MGNRCGKGAELQEYNRKKEEEAKRAAEEAETQNLLEAQEDPMSESEDETGLNPWHLLLG